VLWNVNWGPRFFPDIMSRNRFREIMRYLRFDLKRTRSQHLQNDKFALASEYGMGSLITAFFATDLERILMQMNDSSI